MESWTAAAPMRRERTYHTATLLADGRVLVAGGEILYGVLAESEIYDPVSNQWMDTGPMIHPRRFHTALLLSDRRVLVAGGIDAFTLLDSAEIFDPGTRLWSSAGSLSGMHLSDHAMVALDDGRALVIGGRILEGIAAVSIPWVQIYDSRINSWSLGPPLSAERYRHTATVLK